MLDQPSPVAWWLEIQGAGNASPKGRFTGAPGGQTDDIQDVAAANGELRFRIEKPRRAASPFPGTWTAHLRDDKLEGRFVVEGQPEVRWLGRRAPGGRQNLSCCSVAKI